MVLKHRSVDDSFVFQYLFHTTARYAHGLAERHRFAWSSTCESCPKSGIGVAIN